MCSQGSISLVLLGLTLIVSACGPHYFRQPAREAPSDRLDSESPLIPKSEPATRHELDAEAERRRLEELRERISRRVRTLELSPSSESSDTPVDPECESEVVQLVRGILDRCETADVCYDINSPALERIVDKIIATNDIAQGEYDSLISRLDHTAVFWRSGEQELGDAISLEAVNGFRKRIREGKHILVVGRASRSGSRRANQILAAGRAIAVKNYIVRLGLQSPGNVTILVFGEETDYLSQSDFQVLSAEGISRDDYDRSSAILNQSAWVFVSDCEM